MMAGIVAGGRPLVSVSATDPYWSNVSARLHMDGADASTTIVDQKGGSWAASGNAQIKTDVSKFGGAALRLDGVGDVVTGPDSDAFDFGAGDFTIEFWFYCDSSLGAGTTQRVFSAKWGTGITKAWLVDYYLGNLRCVVDDLSYSSFVTQAEFNFTAGNWYHIAWSRSAGISRIFVDGAMVRNETFAHNISPASTPVLIGYKGDGAGTEYLNGRIDEFRVTKGVARYTAAFSAPSSAFPDS